MRRVGGSSCAAATGTLPTATSRSGRRPSTGGGECSRHRPRSRRDRCPPCRGARRVPGASEASNVGPRGRGCGRRCPAGSRERASLARRRRSGSRGPPARGRRSAGWARRRTRAARSRARDRRGTSRWRRGAMPLRSSTCVSPSSSRACIRRRSASRGYGKRSGPGMGSDGRGPGLRAAAYPGCCGRSVSGLRGPCARWARSRRRARRTRGSRPLRPYRPRPDRSPRARPRTRGRPPRPAPRR